MKSVAVVGASLAGLTAARSLRKQGYEGRLTVIGEEAHRPYDRPPLSKEFLAGQIDESALGLEAEGENPDAEWLLGARAVGLDGPGHAIRLADGGTVRADGIVLATGAAARTLPGSERLQGVHTLRTLEDARALRQDLGRGGKAVVIGGGFIGAEVASTARGLGLDVTMIQAGPTLMAGALGAEMGSLVSLLHTDHGVHPICGVSVRALTGNHRVDGVLLEDDRWIPADTVVVGVGARPCTQWLQGSGVALENGVRCDASGATTVPGIVAVGDCASWYDPVAQEHHRIEHWAGARERPATAVRSLLSGGMATYEPPRPPYFWSDQYGARIQFTGHRGTADGMEIEEGSPDDRSFLAVYRRAGHPVAVLGVNRPRPFMRWRRWLAGSAVRKTVAL